jgi:hypothetical protein
MYRKPDRQNNTVYGVGKTPSASLLKKGVGGV